MKATLRELENKVFKVFNIGVNKNRHLATLTVLNDIRNYKVYEIEGSDEVIEGGNEVMGFIFLPKELNVDTGEITLTF